SKTLSISKRGHAALVNHKTRSAGLCCGLIKSQLEVRPSMFPRHLMADFILSARTMNFDGRRSSCQKRRNEKAGKEQQRSQRDGVFEPAKDLIYRSRMRS